MLVSSLDLAFVLFASLRKRLFLGTPVSPSCLHEQRVTNTNLYVDVCVMDLQNCIGLHLLRRTLGIRAVEEKFQGDSKLDDTYSSSKGWLMLYGV